VQALLGALSFRGLEPARRQRTNLDTAPAVAEQEQRIRQIDRHGDHECSVLVREKPRKIGPVSVSVNPKTRQHIRTRGGSAFLYERTLKGRLYSETPAIRCALNEPDGR
jgi:hypothetical protein